MTVIGVPAVLIALAALGPDRGLSGFAYCFVKASYASFVAILSFPGMFFSAISSDKFRGTVYESLLATPSSKRVSSSDFVRLDITTHRSSDGFTVVSTQNPL